MKNKNKILVTGIALFVICVGVSVSFLLQRRATIADIISDEAEWDLRDAAVRPLPVRIDVNNLADGIYPVSFKQNEIVKAEGGYKIPFEVFNMDLYDTVDLHRMKVGDYIQIKGEFVKIESLAMDGTIYVNGGLDNGGADLISVGGGVYRYQGWDDIATYTSFGKVTLFVPDTVEFVDRGNVEKSMDVLVVPGESAFEYLTTVKYGNFDQYSVKIRIEDGAVVEFSRDYRP